MHTQRESADYVVSQEAHFHFTVKGNQNFFEAFETWFELDAKHHKPAYQKPWHKDHGRIASRKIWITDKLNALSKDETSAQEVLRVNQGHWAVESSHCMLDGPHAFDEDASRTRCGRGPENMACIRRFALIVLRHYQRRSKKPAAITE